MSSKHLPQLETLFKDSFERFKSRFLSWFLAAVVSFGAALVVIATVVLLGLLHAAIFAATQSAAMVGISVFITGIATIIGMVYVFSWITLVIIDVVITDHPAGLKNTFVRTRPYVWGFVWFAIISSLLIAGIVFLGILGFFIGALILSILWGIWNSFSVFVYLENRYRGLANLWASYHTVNKQFWGVFGRLFLLYLAIYFVFILLSMGAVGENAGLFNAIIQILNILVSPFIIAYTYEIYRHLRTEEPNTKPVTGWIVTSVIGWIVGIALIILVPVMFIGAIINSGEEFGEGFFESFQEELQLDEDLNISEDLNFDEPQDSAPQEMQEELEMLQDLEQDLENVQSVEDLEELQQQLEEFEQPGTGNESEEI